MARENQNAARQELQVAVDIVLFSLQEGQPQVLLVQRGVAPYKGKWAFPGGHVEIDEDLETAARRELAEETGITKVELEQLCAFGDPDRDPRGRVISIMYCGVLGAETADIAAGSDAAEVAWFAIDALPGLAFDHATMLAYAKDWWRQQYGL